MKSAAKCLLGALALLLILPTAALAAPTQPIAEVENLGDTLIFHPNVQFATLVLTVTGPCDVQYRQRYTEGEPRFTLDPKTMIDGFYRYDLMREETIDPDIIQMLLEARQNNDPETPRMLCRAGKLPAAPISQSEGFRVMRGEIIYDHETIEKSVRADRDTPASGGTIGLGGGGSVVPTKDFVIIDDLIVDGSACIGFDCVNGESFGFDTIRVKENNLRIKFDDTSTAASFPRNDWQLTANDSANGGASKFSIDDISNSRTPFTVEANARSHSLYVDDGGRIGSRTSTPSVEIHTIDGDTPTLRLQQDGSSGFAPQTWDVAGNETNFFVRDVTNGSALPFRIRPGAPSSSIFIDVDGSVGLGTSSPDWPLHIVGSEGAVKLERNSATNPFVIYNRAGNQISFFDDTAGQDRLTVDSNGDLGLGTVTPAADFDIVRGAAFSRINAGATTFTASSSRSLKKNLQPVESDGILDKMAGVQVYTYDFIDGPANRLGLMAEDFHTVFGRGSDKMLDGQEVSMALWIAVQELKARNDKLSEELSELKAQLTEETAKE